MLSKKIKIILFLFLLSIFQPSTFSADGPLDSLREFWSANKELRAVSGHIWRKKNVPYVDNADDMQKLDIYFPKKSDKPFAVLVHFHGGGWRTGDKKMMKAVGKFYAKHGILFIAPDYRLSPKVRHPAHAEDCAAALAWVFKNVERLGGDRSRIFLSGHSSGAHLAALLATSPVYLEKYGIRSTQLAGVVAVDTASFDFLKGEREKLVKFFISEAFGKDEAVLKEASPYHNIVDGKAYPKFLVFNTTEREVAVQGGRDFYDRLKKAGANARFVPVSSHNHKEMADGMLDESDPVGKNILEFIR